MTRIIEALSQAVESTEPAVLTTKCAVSSKPIIPLSMTEVIADYSVRSRSRCGVEVVSGDVARLLVP